MNYYFQNYCLIKLGSFLVKLYTLHYETISCNKTLCWWVKIALKMCIKGSLHCTRITACNVLALHPVFTLNTSECKHKCKQKEIFWSLHVCLCLRQAHFHCGTLVLAFMPVLVSLVKTPSLLTVLPLEHCLLMRFYDPARPVLHSACSAGQT